MHIEFIGNGNNKCVDSTSAACLRMGGVTSIRDGTDPNLCSWTTCPLPRTD
jgi:hypothetical protein